MNYAGFWTRVLASIIDTVIVQICAGLVGGIVGAVYGAGGGSVEGAGVLGFFIGLLGGWFYYAIMESSPKQATLGKMAMEIYVADLDGNRITFAKATGRYFAKILSGLVLLVGYIMAAFTDKKQALHDKLAGTLVLQGKGR